MGVSNYLTNEKLSEKFVSSFDLVNYAIKLVRNYIETGRRPNINTTSDNPAFIVLSEIREGVEQYDEPENYEQTLNEAKEAIAQKGLELVKATLRD